MIDIFQVRIVKFEYINKQIHIIHTETHEFRHYKNAMKFVKECYEHDKINNTGILLEAEPPNIFEVHYLDKPNIITEIQIIFRQFLDKND